MGKNQDNKTEYDLDRLLQGSLGYDDDQLLEKMRLAEETIDDSSVPPALEDGFEHLMAECERRGIVPNYEEAENRRKNEFTNPDVIMGNKDKGEAESKRKIRGLGPLIRIAIAVGVLATVLVFTGIQAGAKRGFEFTKRVRPSTKNDMVLNNGENTMRESDLEKAYRAIHEQTGLNVLRLDYIPAKLEYLETAIGIERAALYFDYNGKSFYIIQQIKTEINSAGIISDRVDRTMVYNEWLEQDIEIEKAVTDTGGEEHSAMILNGNSYYYVAGFLSEEEFIKIIKNVYFTE